MEQKINLAKLLKDCPSGMELNCTMYDDLYFDKVDTIGDIKCYIKSKDDLLTHVTFRSDGSYNTISTAKCVIFPKGKTTWEGFCRPFKDGDIIYNRLQKRICIYYLCKDEVPRIRGCRYNEFNTQFEKLEYPIPITIQDYRLATEEEKKKFFNVIKDNGYKWNPETKTLDKLIIHKFKVGDKIQHKITILTIIEVQTNKYIVEDDSNNFGMLCFSTQDNWELIPDKFDVTTLKPFDKVLARCSSLEKWRIQFFEKFDKTCKFPFICMGYNKYKQCIPYEGNEHLLDTADNCDEFYKIW